MEEKSGASPDAAGSRPVSGTCGCCRWMSGALCRNPWFSDKYWGVVVSVDEGCERWEGRGGDQAKAVGRGRG